jgi:hypothetical protein
VLGGRSLRLSAKPAVQETFTPAQRALAQAA